MKVKTVSTWVITLTLFFVYAVHLSFGQNLKLRGSKMVWSPPDKSFTIEVPVRLKEIKGEYNDESHSGYNSIKLFGAKKSNYVFLVFVLELVEKEKKLSSEDKFGGLEFVLGGDDDHEFTEKFMKIEGFAAKEIVYSNQNKKGLMIDAGDRIFILGLAVKNRKDLDSSLATHFFTSFYLLRDKN